MVPIIKFTIVLRFPELFFSLLLFRWLLYGLAVFFYSAPHHCDSTVSFRLERLTAPRGAWCMMARGK